MAGALTISTLNDSSGVLATQNGMTGISKAWVNFNGTGTVAIRDSFNVSSITDNGTGDYTINFTTAMPNANYSVSALSSTVASYNSASVPTTSSIRVIGYSSVFAATDSAYFYVSVFSS